MGRKPSLKSSVLVVRALGAKPGAEEKGGILWDEKKQEAVESEDGLGMASRLSGLGAERLD